MDLLVPPSLTLNVALDNIFIGVLSDCVHVEATRPEVSSPENFLHLRMAIEDVFGREALDDLYDA